MCQPRNGKLFRCFVRIVYNVLNETGVIATYPISQKSFGKFINICREVCMSSLENINTSDQEVKTMDIRSFLSGIEYNLPIKLWMGETRIEFKKLVSILTVSLFIELDITFMCIAKTFLCTCSIRL
jgi:hypothetical protein